MKLYDQIQQLIPTLHGWAEIPKAITLANLVLARKPRYVVELGVWGGRSFFPMALALKELGSGTAIAVDPWDSQASVEGQVTDADRKWWGEVANHELVYQHFIYHVEKLGLTSIVEIHRERSELVELVPEIGILHLDQNHGPQALAETMRVAPKIEKNGFIILDDCQWAGGHVQKCSDWLKENGFIELHPLGTGAVYLRTK